MGLGLTISKARQHGIILAMRNKIPFILREKLTVLRHFVTSCKHLDGVKVTTNGRQMFVPVYKYTSGCVVDYNCFTHIYDWHINRIPQPVASKHCSQYIGCLGPVFVTMVLLCVIVESPRCHKQDTSVNIGSPPSRSIRALAKALAGFSCYLSAGEVKKILWKVQYNTTRTTVYTSACSVHHNTFDQYLKTHRLSGDPCMH